jgi:hypothetical protein
MVPSLMEDTTMHFIHIVELIKEEFMHMERSVDKYVY